MKRNRKLPGSVLATAFMLASAGAIFSQQPSGNLVFQRQPFMQEPGSAPRTQPPGDDTFYFISNEMGFDGKLVKGAPYSAEAVTESTQMLADGNRIVNQSTTRLYRDSEGRTRREQTLRSIGPFANAGEPSQMIFINDPVAQMSYTLDIRNHVALKMPSFRFEVRVAPPAEGSKPSAADETGPPPPQRRENNGNTYVISSTPAPNGQGYRVEYRGGGNNAKAESLGKQIIEGVEAEGTRTTVTIPAGEIGNDQAINIVNERWYSPELQTVVMSRRSDPRFGETIYRLTNIDRSEPAKSLFEVPADYTIKAGPDMKGISTSAVSANSAKTISGGVLNGKAISMPAPEFPVIARAAHASGDVTVQVTIDEDGNVIAATGKAFM